MYSELDQDRIETMLAAEHFGNLGCCLNDKPYVFPMAYVYHDDVIYGQTTTGYKVDVVRKNPHVCFQVHRVYDEGWCSVQCWGTFEELDFDEVDDPDAKRITTLLIDKLASIQKQIGVEINFNRADGAHPLSVNGKKSTLFRIVLSEKSGRYHGAIGDSKT